MPKAHPYDKWNHQALARVNYLNVPLGLNGLRRWHLIKLTIFWGLAYGFHKAAAIDFPGGNCNRSQKLNKSQAQYLPIGLIYSWISALRYWAGLLFSHYSFMKLIVIYTSANVSSKLSKIRAWFWESHKPCHASLRFSSSTVHEKTCGLLLLVMSGEVLVI